MASIFGATQGVNRAPNDTSYPGANEVYFAKQFDQTYGNPVALFQDANVKTKKLSVDQLMKLYGDITGRAFKTVIATASTPMERDAILKNWIAAQKSPLSALGFDPRVTIHTDTTGQEVNLAGFYRPETDTLWYEDTHQDASVHEAMHRGINRLLKSAVPVGRAKEWLDSGDKYSSNPEEMLVRALKVKYFGDIEMGSGSVGDQQVSDAKWHMTEAPHSKLFNGAMDDIESAAANLIASEHPGGPR